MLLVLAACASRQVIVEDRGPAARQGQQTETSATSYSVIAGDTLSSIARRFAVSVRALQQHNRMADPHQLEVGDRLLIPGSGSEPFAASKSVPQPAFIWPLARVQITSAFGARGGAHKGVDMSAAKGTRIRAAADGVVSFAGRQNGYGRVVILQHSGDIRTLYAHNRKNKVKVGQRVAQGETIAKVGASGNASGTHLHFEYIRAGRQVDPQRYIYR